MYIYSDEPKWFIEELCGIRDPKLPPCVTISDPYVPHLATGVWCVYVQLIFIHLVVVVVMVDVVLLLLLFL